MMAKAMRDVELHYLIVQFLTIRISSRGGGGNGGWNHPVTAKYFEWMMEIIVITNKLFSLLTFRDAKYFFRWKTAEFLIQTSVSVTSSNRSRMTANTGASNEIVMA